MRYPSWCVSDTPDITSFGAERKLLAEVARAAFPGGSCFTGGKLGPVWFPYDQSGTAGRFSPVATREARARILLVGLFVFVPCVSRACTQTNSVGALCISHALTSWLIIARSRCAASKMISGMRHWLAGVILLAASTPTQAETCVRVLVAIWGPSSHLCGGDSSGYVLRDVQLRQGGLGEMGCLRSLAEP